MTGIGGGVYGDMVGVFLELAVRFSGEEVSLAMFIASGKEGDSRIIEEVYG